MTNNCFQKDILDKAHIMVVGCGALGNEVLKNLALMGIGNIVIVDFDNVEPHNLTRSILFSTMDNPAGKPKVEIAGAVIKKINPEINLKLIKGDISADVGLGQIKEMDVVIGCVDNRWARYCINRICMRAGVPWIDGGISELEGTVKIYEPGKNCYACSLTNEDLSEMKKRFSCAGNIRRAFQTKSAPTTPIMASIIGAMETQEALKIINNKYSEQPDYPTLSGKIFFYDGKYLTSGVVAMEAFDDSCCHHEEWSPTIDSLMTTDMKLSDLIEELTERFGSNVVINLCNDTFVESIIDKDTDQEFIVNLPGRRVERFIETTPSLNKKPLSDYYQKEMTEFHRDSNQTSMTLRELGIPEKEFLKVRDMRGNEYYIRIK